MERVVKIWTDGSGNNPGSVGWAAILVRSEGSSRIVGGHAENSTVNRAETMAVIQALEALKRPCNVVINTDSQYVVNGIKRLMRFSKLKTNVDLWERLRPLVFTHSVKVNWVQGHSADIMNDLADTLAGYAWRKQKPFDAYIEDLRPLIGKSKRVVYEYLEAVHVP